MATPSTTTSNVNNTSNPWTGQQGYLTDLYNNAQGAYGATPKTPYGGTTYAGPNSTQYGALSGIDAWARGNTQLGDATRGSVNTLSSLASNPWASTMQLGAGQGTYQMGPNYNWGALNLTPAAPMQGNGQLGTDIRNLAGAAPDYAAIDTGQNITRLTGLAPNYQSQYNSAVAGATAPIMQQFTNQVLPALSSAHALTGGASSRHTLQDQDAVSTFGRAIGDSVASKGLDLANLNAGTFNNLSGIASNDVNSLRSSLGSDWQTLVGQAGGAFQQGRALTSEEQQQLRQIEAQYQTAMNQAGTQANLGRESINSSAFSDAGSRALQNQGQGIDVQGQQLTARQQQLQALGLLPTNEAAGYTLGMTPFQTLLQSGTTAQGWDQTNADDLYQQWVRSQQAPWQGLDQYSNIVQGGGSPSGSTTSNTTSSTTGGGSSTIANALKGGIGGALTGSALAGTSAGASLLAALGIGAGPFGLMAGGLGALLGII